MPLRSSRLDMIPPYLFAEISRVKREAIQAGADVIDLGIGDPDIPTPKPVIEALAVASQDPATHRYDETAHGWTPFLRAASKWYEREFSASLSVENELVQLIGSKEGLAHLCWTYLDAGDVAIVPNPAYSVYKVNSQMAGAEVFEMPLHESTGFLPDLTTIPTDIAKRAKLLFVCYPNNPTGAIADRDFYEDAVRFCREFDILLVNDMAYATVAYEGHHNPTALQIPGAKDVTIEFHSLSKMFNMTGWRLGFAAGNSEAIANLARFKSNIDSKQFPAIAEAGAHALLNVDNSETLGIYEKRRDFLCDGLANIGWNVPKPRATFYVWARVPRDDMSSADFCQELLARAHVVTIPGTGYGSEGEGYLRMSLTLLGDRAGERFSEAVNRIAKSGLIPSLVS